MRVKQKVEVEMFERWNSGIIHVFDVKSLQIFAFKENMENWRISKRAFYLEPNKLAEDEKFAGYKHYRA